MTTERTESGQTGLLPGMPELQAFDPDLPARLKADLDEAEEKAWDSLARYKFQMFQVLCGDAGESRPKLSPTYEVVPADEGTRSRHSLYGVGFRLTTGPGRTSV